LLESSFFLPLPINETPLRYLPNKAGFVAPASHRRFLMLLNIRESAGKMPAPRDRLFVHMADSSVSDTS
jgi:hypothetical protein